MTWIDIDTNSVRQAGRDLQNKRDWDTVWELLRQLDVALSTMGSAADASTQSYVNSAKNAINSLKWDHLAPISEAMNRLGNICVESADKFEQVDDKWNKHFESTGADHVITPISWAMDQVKEGCRDDVRQMLLDIAHDFGLEELINDDTVDIIVDKVLDALPGLILDGALAFASGGTAVGLLLADLGTLVASTVAEIAIDKNLSNEKVKSLYAFISPGISYDEEGYSVSTIKDTYDLRGLSDATPKAKALSGSSVGQLFLDVDSKVSSIEYDGGYEYQCFGQETGHESKNKDRGLAKEQEAMKQREKIEKFNKMPMYDYK